MEGRVPRVPNQIPKPSVQRHNLDSALPGFLITSISNHSTVTHSKHWQPISNLMVTKQRIVKFWILALGTSLEFGCWPLEFLPSGLGQSRLVSLKKCEGDYPIHPPLPIP